ncbi:UPF0597 protein [Tepiditoga spiralis]|uniref:UPF0597 protein n=1 Tax=Tepiditoga spiralis TaxID=2108365 RepID=A0A7G1G4Z9_9BACT|nr:L-serine ammonia-lyase, iron-sulfur-dependent, subunit alpha [Tepiditoga spiralis]BBE30326.1 UPF0597 protein [Tepiditoga spiralis]
MIKVKEYIKNEVKEAYGCTEPASVALTVARACQETDEKVENIFIETSKSIYKNGMAVKIPGTNGQRGNIIAAALGSKLNNISLEIFKGCTSNIVKEALKMVNEKKVSVKCLYEKSGVYTKATIKTKNHEIITISEGKHDFISLVLKDGKEIYKNEYIEEDSIKYFELKDGIVDEILNSLKTLDENDLNFITKGIEMNLDAANKCIKEEIPGHELLKNFEDCDMNEIRKCAMAASAARMDGAFVPIMSSGGSGNQGIVTTVPVGILGKNLKKSKKEIAKAAVIAHLISGYIKDKVGKLAPICGAFFSAGAGAAGALTWLMGGNIGQIEQAIETMLSNTTGIMCDGAKESCAFRVGTAVAEAHAAAIMVLKKTHVACSEGFIDCSLEKTIDNVVKINKAFENLDNTLIKIIEERY